MTNDKNVPSADEKELQTIMTTHQQHPARGLAERLWKYRRFLLHLPINLYFNFRYLPFRQAVKLPIIIGKMHLVSCKGKVVIDAPRITPGMIHLGFREVSLYPDNGFTWDNKGATVIFRGHCIIGNDSYFSCGGGSTVDIGDDFVATAGMKLVSYRGIRFGQSARLGWDVVVMDTNFHPLYDMEKKQFKRASGPIDIGDFNWFGQGCHIMHSTATPERCIFGMGTIVTRGCEKESYCVMGGSPVRVLTRNVMRIIGQDMETYEDTTK